MRLKRNEINAFLRISPSPLFSYSAVSEKRFAKSEVFFHLKKSIKLQNLLLQNTKDLIP